ncbi:hypothetical protein M413DRAFT_187288 [Hebeloma cylindrosporum]|uniref:Uncharacterized protein n=1 Tax=Hebeloma cylindrosporum TaxID=76867 RepID=A0A0C3C8J1_HEBCY|nr:hypothetical protein M413DRAFT_187288 [Hebeloma cylindrosporum h7]
MIYVQLALNLMIPCRHVHVNVQYSITEGCMASILIQVIVQNHSHGDPSGSVVAPRSPRGEEKMKLYKNS